VFPATLDSVLLKSRLCKFNLAMPVVSTLQCQPRQRFSTVSYVCLHCLSINE